MKRRSFLVGGLVLAGGGLLAASRVPAQKLGTDGSSGSVKLDTLSGDQSSTDIIWKNPDSWAEELITAAEDQIGVTVLYDPGYVGLTFPNGDIPRERGVCTDVIVRAYRDAFDFDLQREVNADMKNHFSAYPQNWGLKRPDKNIDHRRVPNLQTFFTRKGAGLPVSDDPRDYLPGDIVSQLLPGNLPHMAIVTHRKSPDGQRPMLVHNIGSGTKLEDRLFSYRITGRYRFQPA